MLLFELAQLGEDRQTQHLGAKAFGRWHGSRFKVEMRVSGLTVNGNRVIDDRADALILQALFQPVAAAAVRQSMTAADRRGTAL